MPGEGAKVTNGHKVIVFQLLVTSKSLRRNRSRLQ